MSRQVSDAQMYDIRENPFKQDYPLLAKNEGLAYLDSTATAQRPQVVLDAQQEFYTHMNANPLRGLYSLSVEATAAIEASRIHIARFIGALTEDELTSKKNREAAAQQIVFGRNASEMLNLLASSLSGEDAAELLGGKPLGTGDEILITIMEHHSNLIPWQKVARETGAKLVYLYPEHDGTITQVQIDAAISEQTRIVSVTHVSNVLGVELPVAAITQRAHEMGALVIVDSAQGVPHVSTNVRELGCDFLVFSAHKLGGPLGVGVLWGKPKLLEALPPFLLGGEMIDAVTEHDAVWAAVPHKFEAGTQDAAGIYATDAALSYLESFGMERLEKREQLLASYLTEQLAGLDFIELYGPRDGAWHKGAVAFNVRGIHPHDVASLLDAHQVCIRAGHHCAQPLLTWLGQESTCRASVAFYNDASDIDQLIAGLTSVWGIFNGKR